MSDRELLELAAKAAGYSIRGERFNPDHFTVEHSLGVWIHWNPLTDDGDALRLAVKLNLHEAIKLAHRLLGGEGCGDMYAATRRAIVRAAAEIGRAMT
jgi:hypothetical protein